MKIGKYRIEWNKNTPPLVKKYYFLSCLLWIPPFHELGHVIIAILTGGTIVKIDWFFRVSHIPTTYDWLHTVWEVVTVFIPIIFISFFLYENFITLKNKGVKNEENKQSCSSMFDIIINHI